MLHKRIVRTEFLGILVSLICAVHCLAMPAILICLGSSINEHAHGAFDISILLLASLFMAYTFKQSIGKVHFSKILILTLFGALTFLLSFFVGTPFNHYCFVGGSIFWLIAHFINYRSHSDQLKNV